MSNAQIKRDFFYVRDSRGKKIIGKTIRNGEKIQVLNVDYARQLVKVEYPTPEGTRKGYITVDLSAKLMAITAPPSGTRKYRFLVRE